MPPQTRSRGVPAPSRVYHSTPAEQQAHFPARRKVVRTYGKQARKKDNVAPARSLRQQTLTQIDFVSSFEEERDPVVFSDSDSNSDGDEKDEDDTEIDEDKENRSVQNQEITEEEEDEEPISSGRKRRANSTRPTTKNERTKRRRTVGDDPNATHDDTENEKGNRRKTLGDLPTSSYHTQTLTQFLGRDPSHTLFIRDSDDEGEDGFEDWLQDPTSPSPLRRRKNVDHTPSTARKLRFVSPDRTQAVSESPTTTRQESVVPQTPIKVRTPAKPTVRDEIPSSDQLSSPLDMPTPVHRMMERYGPPNAVGSPLKNKSSPTPKSILKRLPGETRSRNLSTPRKKEVVIQDSLATESWGNEEPTPQRSQKLGSPIINRVDSAETEETSSALDEMETPTKPRHRYESTEPGHESKTGNATPRKLSFSPRKGKRIIMDEIPDSDEEDGDFDVFDENQDEHEFVAGPVTQLVMSEISSTEEPLRSRSTSSSALEISGQENMAPASSIETTKTRRPQMTSSPLVDAAPSSQPTTLPPTSPSGRKVISNRRRVREPLHAPTVNQTQPLESQRVPVPTLQALPPASARTDIILPLDRDILANVLEGYQADLRLSFKIPPQVVRFWLFDGNMLQYMACADPGRIDGSESWRYALPQVYELNNPVDDKSMREEEWVDGEIDRYAYLPPALVGQLLWNLRHAVFSEGDAHPLPREEEEEEDEDNDEQVQLLPSPSRPQGKKNPTPTPSLSVSQQVEAQLQSEFEQSTHVPTSDDILVPSTPEGENDKQQRKTSTTNSISSTPTRASSKNSGINTFKPPPARLPPLTPFAPSSYRASRPPLNPVRPSQATTVSQTSTPEKASTPHQGFSYPQLLPSSSLLFNDDSPLHLPSELAAVADNGTGVEESQLLTKSQTLPDSLIRDDDCMPPEIWDSDDDLDTRL
ncbi:hypothetical protein BGZ63DRAFT_390583 [Mariannaea sp. PMI_226]|nr:hypothetical protein BGZ63DRAFT_390583 [Mariannaea sp. PMI_226]